MALPKQYPARKRDLHYDNERHNMASDYIYGSDNKNPELGFPDLSFDDYVSMVQAFKQMAQTFDLPEPPEPMFDFPEEEQWTTM